MEENRNQETDFMKETIKQRPLNRKKLVRRTLITAAMAVIFGMVACLTFLLLEPVFSNKLYPEEEPSTIAFVEETQEDEILPEDMIADESQMKTEGEETPALEDEQIAQVLSEINMGVEEFSSIYTALYEVAKGVQASMVTVAGVTSDVDMFNNPYENEDIISGVIVADNNKELFILANSNMIQGADSFKVTFSDGGEYQAVLKRKDNNTGLAVLSVARSTIKASTLETIKPADLGTSNSKNLTGSPIIAVGRPMGNADSLCYGFITSSGNPVNLPDSTYKLMTTDIYGSSLATGVLVNLRGQVVGVIDTVNNSSDTKNIISAIGITELKKVIACLSNDEEIAYMGVHIADVTEETNQSMGVPFGVYITEIDMDSPAMNAGIQSGDVIVKIGETEITTCQDFVNCLLNLEPDKAVPIGFMRQGADGYIEMDLTVTPGVK